MTTQTTFAKFESDFNSIENFIEFNPVWKNGTGYFDKAVKLAKIPAGEYAKSACPETARRILMLGTAIGTIVVFERYTPGIGESERLVCNAPSALNAVMGGNYIDDDRYHMFITKWNNLSHMVDGIIKASAAINS